MLKQYPVKYFNLEELVDKKTFEEEGGGAWNYFSSDALMALDDLHDFFTILSGKTASITVNNWKWGGPFQFRGFRPSWYQPGVTPGSAHRKGKAFDCDVKGYTAEQARIAIIANKESTLVAKIQRVEGAVNWLHFDLMPPPEGHDRIYTFKV